jgi:hypothetical protein
MVLPLAPRRREDQFGHNKFGNNEFGKKRS